ncbi:MAG: trypsin-like peptidase domain-containing protein [Anaerolineae bacterium]|nr:trypsin-like peptidase domain-containing protein [Anaerolineae bacterium]
MSSLQTLSNDLAGVVAAASVGVVRVDARRRLPATGFVLTADGLIVTAHHVVHHEEINIGLADGRQVKASLVGRDPSTDLALLRAEVDGLTPLPHAAAADLSVGHLVLALGRPGQTVQATLGIISASGGSWRTSAGGSVDQYIQTDVIMYPGFSGGPLVNAAGQVIGLNSSALSQGVSLTIPASTVQRVTDTLLTHGKMRRGYLGISTQRVRLPNNLREQLGRKSGLLIIAVDAETPAAAAGLVLGDTLVALDGQIVRTHDDLLALLAGDRVGQKVPAEIIRGGELQTILVTIGERG